MTDRITIYKHPSLGLMVHDPVLQDQGEKEKVLLWSVEHERIKFCYEAAIMPHMTPVVNPAWRVLKVTAKYARWAKNREFSIENREPLVKEPREDDNLYARTEVTEGIWINGKPIESVKGEEFYHWLKARVPEEMVEMVPQGAFESKRMRRKLFESLKHMFSGHV